MSQIVCKNLVLGYEKHAVAEDINFSVNQGDYLCILGENGSGKSTLIKTLLGLTKPLSGEIQFGERLSAKEIGYLPQQTLTQRDFPASVWEIVRSGCLNRIGFRPFYSAAEKEIARENMELLGITSLANKCYRELSGGQQQRVLLARALCATRKMLLLDEPVAGLDPKATAELYEVIYELNQKHGTTIIMVSHDIMAAVPYASHVLHLSNKPLFFGTKDDYIKSPVGQIYAASAILHTPKKEAEEHE